jgi:serine/threonine-protein kinase
VRAPAAAARRIGPWALEERIGAGGQGVLWRARHATLGEPVALKLVHRSVWADPGFRVRFRRECDALAALAHPGVVPVRDAGEHDGQGFLVMRLARGGSLAGALREGPLAPPAALALLARVAGALDAAHAAGLVHRDVTAGNILLDPDGPWLGDFGLARRIDATALTGEGVLIGTAGYLAPEVIAGGPAGPASDRYALAVVAFEALTGRRPFRADAVPALLWAHLHREPPRASTLAPGLPRRLDAVLARALAKDPRDRPASAGAMVAAVARALETDESRRTAVLVRPRRVRAARRRPRRARAAALLGAGALLVGGAGAAGGWALSGSGAPAPAAAAAPVVHAVPGPGADLPAGPAGANDLPGVAIPDDASATVLDDVGIAALPGGWRTLGDVRDALTRRGFRLEPRDAGDGAGSYLAGIRPGDLMGLGESWALLAVTDAGGPRAVVLHGAGQAVAGVARALAAAPGRALTPVP